MNNKLHKMALDWQAVALREAAENLGTTEGAARLVESKRYGLLATALEAKPSTRSQKLADAGYTRRPSARCLPSDADEPSGVVPLPDREALIDLIREKTSYGVYHCTRVWEAWNVGTMTEADFSPYAESDSPEELADIILAYGDARAAAARQAGHEAQGQPLGGCSMETEAVEELHQLGYTVRDGLLYPPESGIFVAPAAVSQVGEPVAWMVYVASADNQYVVDDIEDAQLIDDCTNHDAVVTPLYAAPGVADDVARDAIRGRYRLKPVEARPSFCAPGNASSEGCCGNGACSFDSETARAEREFDAAMATDAKAGE